MKELYNGLLNLSKINEAFYFSDQDILINDTEYTVRSFSYRLVPYSDFKTPYALESRGTAFYSEKGKKNWKLFSRMFPKFFNINEGIPKEEYIKDNKILNTYEKLDGSLIAFGKIEDKIIAKSKTSINSDQAKMAQDILDSDENLKKFVNDTISLNKTPIFELIGSENVIVIRYNTDKDLILLGIVDNITGIITMDSSINSAKSYDKTWDGLFKEQETSQENIEGYVVHSERGMCKVKMKKYVDLHRLKDSINNIKSLVSLIIDDNVDDLLASFDGDELTIKYILDTQNEISHRYNALIESVERLYYENKDLSRKKYAIKLKKYSIFGLLMIKYLNENLGYNKEIDFKEFFIKNKMYEGL